MNFTAIDFETATAYHPCSVGIVTVENGVIVDEFVSLIKPPNNEYNLFTIQVHGIYPKRYSKGQNLYRSFSRNKKKTSK
jgi:DNA polymerase-3 subunit epsilon